METNSSTLSALEPLLSIDELADYLHVPVTTIRDWRTDGKGPCAIKVGGRVRFATSDVLAWLVRQRESEPGHGPRVKDCGESRQDRAVAAEQRRHAVALGLGGS